MGTQPVSYYYLNPESNDQSFHSDIHKRISRLGYSRARFFPSNFKCSQRKFMSKHLIFTIYYFNEIIVPCIIISIT